MLKEYKGEIKIRIELNSDFVMKYNETYETILIDWLIEKIKDEFKDEFSENEINIDDKLKLLTSFVISFKQIKISFQEIKSVILENLKLVDKSQNAEELLIFYKLEGKLAKNKNKRKIRKKHNRKFKFATSSEKNKLSYYSIFGHRVFLLICLIVFTIILTIVGVLVTRGLFWFFSFIPFLLVEQDLTYLSSFLGGLLGIVVGFFIDAIIISRWKRLKNYQMLLDLLLNEFEDIERALLILYKMKKERGEMFEVSTPVIKSIVENVDNISIFYNLPRYLNFEEKGNFVREIKVIKKEIDGLNCNESISLEKLLEKCINLQVRIEKFRNCTDSFKHREKVVK